MATTYGTFDFASATTGGSQDFIYNGPNQTNTTAPVTTGNRNWTWRNGDTPSTGMGPTSGQGGSPEGYIYTESSDTGVGLNDVYTAEFDQNMNFATESFELTFYTNQRGDENNVVCQVQINENGGGWVDVGSAFGGSGDPNKVATSGTDIWALRTVDLSNGGANTNTSTRMRIELTFPSAGTTWHNDYGLDTITVTGTDLAPIITDVDGDESIGVTQTNVILTGSNLGTNTGQAKVEISPNNTYAAGGLVQQTIDSWADTSIQFDVVRTGLSTGTNYVWVTKSDGTQNVSAFAITLVGNTPSITSVDGDNSLAVGQTNITVLGTNFESAQGSGKLELSASATYGTGLVLQSIDTWSNTSIQFDLNSTGLSAGTIYAYVTNNDGIVSAAQTLTLEVVVPSISSFNGGSPFFADNTGIIILGTGFLASDVGVAKVEIGNASTYAGSGTKVELTVTSWSDTSLTVNGSRGSLSTGTVYVYVTNSAGGVNSSGLSTTLSSVIPSVSTLDGDGGAQNASITAGETVTMTGTNFRTTQTTGVVEVCNNITYSSATVKNSQPITSWGNTSVSFTLSNVSGLSEGTNYIFITNGTGEVS
jgi:hypothetical protein